MEHRAERIVRLYGLTKQTPQKRLTDKDNKRRVYYRHYTGRIWGDPHNDDLSLSTSALGAEKVAEIIANLAK